MADESFFDGDSDTDTDPDTDFDFDFDGKHLNDGV